MKAPNITKTPWAACFMEYQGVAETYHIAGAKHGSNKPIVYSTHTMPETELRANAVLIAAAPLLAEALNALYEDYKGLADSGDAGFWKLEDLPVGKQAIAALLAAGYTDEKGSGEVG